MNHRTCQIFIASAALAGGLSAQTPLVDRSMVLPGLTQSSSGKVLAITTLPNGSIAFGSNETASVLGKRLSLTGLYDGAQWSDFGAGIAGTAGFATTTGVAAFVHYKGNLVAGGRFAVKSNTSIRNIARWTGTAWVAMGSISNWIRALAVYKNQLYAGGEFLAADGKRAWGLARWDGTKWAEVGGGLSRSNGRLPGEVHALLPGSDGTLWVAGRFTRAGLTAATNVVRWNGSSWAAVPGGGLGSSASTVYSLVEFGNKVHAGGLFSFTAPDSKVYRSLAVHSGRAWDHVGGSLPGGQVRVLAVFKGALYVAGNFDRIGSNTILGGIQANSMARWDGRSYSHVGDVMSGTVRGFVFALHATAKRLYVGGDFDTLGLRAPFTAVGSNNLASFDGGVWRTVGVPGSGSVGIPTAMAALGDGFVFAGTKLGPLGSAAPGVLHHFDGTYWRSLRAGTTSGGSIHALIAFNGEIVAGGSFFRIGGQPISSVARWNGKQWLPMGRSGTPSAFAVYKKSLYMISGTLRRWSGTAWQTVGIPLTVTKDLVEYRGKLYVAGQKNLFTNERLFEWDGTTMRAVPGAPSGGRLESVTVHGGELVVAGDFTKVGGGTVTASGVAKWNGVRWAPVGKGIPVTRGFPVFTVRAAGPFLFARGSFVLGRGFAYFDGTNWLGLEGGINGQASQMFVDPMQQDVYVFGGHINGTFSGIPARNLLRVHALPGWRNLGKGHWNAAPARAPFLTGAGGLGAGSRIGFRVRDAAPSGVGLHVIGARRIDVPLFAGVLVPAPDLLVPFLTDAFGAAALSLPVPAGGIPRGVPLYVQDWFFDLRIPAVMGASNAVTRTAP